MLVYWCCGRRSSVLLALRAQDVVGIAVSVLVWWLGSCAVVVVVVAVCW